MAAASPLTNSYYGPSVPPQKTYHRPGRGGDCFGCCCGCIFSLVFKLLLTAVVVVGIVVLALWLAFRPNKVKFHVVDAALSEFALDDATHMLRYNLNLTVAIRNPNKRVGIHYDRIEARPYLEGQRFGSVYLPTFYQGHKNTTTLEARFQGQSYVPLEGSKKSDFETDKTKGVFGIDVKLYLRVRLRVFWGIKSPKLKPHIECELSIPLTTANSTSNSAFHTTSCDFDF